MGSCDRTSSGPSPANLFNPPGQTGAPVARLWTQCNLISLECGLWQTSYEQDNGVASQIRSIFPNNFGNAVISVHLPNGTALRRASSGQVTTVLNNGHPLSESGCSCNNGENGNGQTGCRDYPLGVRLLCACATSSPTPFPTSVPPTLVPTSVPTARAPTPAPTQQPTPFVFNTFAPTHLPTAWPTTASSTTPTFGDSPVGGWGATDLLVPVGAVGSSCLLVFLVFLCIFCQCRGRHRSKKTYNSSAMQSVPPISASNTYLARSAAAPSSGGSRSGSRRTSRSMARRRSSGVGGIHHQLYVDAPFGGKHLQHYVDAPSVGVQEYHRPPVYGGGPSVAPIGYNDNTSSRYPAVRISSSSAAVDKNQQYASLDLRPAVPDSPVAPSLASQYETMNLRHQNLYHDLNLRSASMGSSSRSRGPTRQSSRNHL